MNNSAGFTLLDLAKAQRQIADETDTLIEQLILEGRISSPSWWVSQRGRFGLFVVALISCGVVAFFYQLWLNRRVSVSATFPNGAQVATALVAATASFFAYYQWTDSRREASLDKFYERLSLVNERYYSWDHARRLVDHFWGGSEEADFQRAMYVYLELDNLEYMISRFQLGFVTKGLLRRAIRTFRSRCQSVAFCNLAMQLVNGAGYQAKTVEIVKRLGHIALRSE